MRMRWSSSRLGLQAVLTAWLAVGCIPPEELVDDAGPPGGGELTLEFDDVVIQNGDIVEVPAGMVGVRQDHVLIRASSGPSDEVQGVVLEAADGVTGIAESTLTLPETVGTGPGEIRTLDFQVQLTPSEAEWSVDIRLYSEVPIFFTVVAGSEGLGVDADMDGHYDGPDCNDSNPAIYPGATEVCNAVDDDCDTRVDEGLPTQTFYADADEDGYGDVFASMVSCEEGLIGYTLDATDCDDTRPTVHPGAMEICNGADDNCDTVADEGLTTTYYADADGDGFGDPMMPLVTCEAMPTGYTLDNTDCDDTRDTVNPEAFEACNEIDDNCNGFADELLPVQTFYADTDHDGYGDPMVSIESCATTLADYSLDNTDCDDTRGSVNPSVPDVANDGVDANCDGADCTARVMGSTTFAICTGSFNWAQARTLCQTAFGDITSVLSATEHAFIRSIMDEVMLNFALIGFTDAVDEGVFRWASGLSSGYTNWVPGEPNDTAMNEDCSAIQGDAGWGWNDVPCDLVTSIVACELR